MKNAIIYSSSTGNTKKLAEAINFVIKDSVLFDKVTDEIFDYDTVYVGFWTNQGTCAPEIKDLLEKLEDKRVFLFGTCGFGSSMSYFKTIIDNVNQHVKKSNIVVGSFICQGKMPENIRDMFVKRLENNDPNAQMMIDNFDQARSHPDMEDINNLKEKLEILLQEDILEF